MEGQNSLSLVGTQSCPGRLETLEEYTSRLGSWVLGQAHHPQCRRELLQEAVYSILACEYVFVYTKAGEQLEAHQLSTNLAQSTVVLASITIALQLTTLHLSTCPAPSV